MLFFGIILVEQHFYSPHSTLVNTHLYRDIFAKELYTVLLHVLSGTVGHVLVEAPQQDGPNHDGDIETQACQETTAL